MQQLKSHDFPKVYKQLDIDLNKLGCVMLDLEPLPGSQKERWENVDLYKSPNKDRFWIDGWVADNEPHVTLLYGLMKEAKEYKKQIDEVLSGWDCEKVKIEKIGFFESTMSDEPYWCIIAHIEVSPNLLEGHQRLQFLPHINTFAEYKPHMTLAYIGKSGGTKYRDMLIHTLNKMWAGKTIKTSGRLNLGGNK